MLNLIKVDYYKGAYGPTIRIGLSSKEALIKMKEILQKLASGSVSECRFHELPFVKKIGLQELHLKLTPKFSDKTVEIAKEKKDKTVFYWTNSLEGWARCMGLLDGFMEDIPSHQYLSDEGIDDALIEVVYLEFMQET